MVRRPMSLLAAAALTSAIVAVGAGPTQAAQNTWAAWGPIAGTSHDFTTTMTQGSPGFPTASVRTDSRGDVAVVSGQSNVLDSATPPGTAYGSSAGSAYLNLRPRADREDAPSRTTYSFDGTTPGSGWAFVLGDVDADRVQVAATDAKGAPVPVATVASWFKETFNYAGNAQEVPSWDPATATLTGRTGFADTDGASGWFEPTTQLSSLTFTFTRLAGAPSYQTWFASRAHAVGGTVALKSVDGAEPCAVEGKKVRLYTGDGREVKTVTTDANGAYSFGDVATRDDYVVRLETGADCRTDQAELSVDNEVDGSHTSKADFTVQGLVPEVISGRVTGDGSPLPGVALELTRPDGTKATALTDADGRYVFDGNQAGTTYQVAVKTPPQGYPAPAPLTGISVAAGGPSSTGNNFALVGPRSLSGTVTGAGEPVGDVPVTLTPNGGAPRSTTTGPDGTYTFPGLQAGTYDIAVTVPAGYAAEPAIEDVVVPTMDLTGQDFALDKLGSVSGKVVDADGAGVADVPIALSGTGAPAAPVVTDADGAFLVADLPAGTYTVTPTAPEGMQVSGESSTEVVVDAAGELVDGLEFVLVPLEDLLEPPATDPVTDPITDPVTDPVTDQAPLPADGLGDEAGTTPDETAGTPASRLPNTGGPSRVLALLGGTLLGGGALVLGGSAVARRRP